MRIEREVNATAAEEISIDQLHAMVEDLLAREEGPDLVSRYHGWREVLRLDRPLMLLIGGATGTGKSTLATEIAYRLGISRITSTDVIRQAMRAFFAQELMPELHYSSFDAAEGLKIPLPDPDDEDRALYGFIQQAGQVAVGANAVVERAVMEGLSTVVEGIHVVPGLVTADKHAGAVVVQVMLTVSDEEVHQAHFFTRGTDSGGLRAMDRYLKRFGEIRRIQEYLVARAEKQGWPVVEAADPAQALLTVMDLILERATARTAAIP
jgi:2-phosphoglycerate kinase